MKTKNQRHPCSSAETTADTLCESYIARPKKAPATALVSTESLILELAGLFSSCSSLSFSYFPLFSHAFRCSERAKRLTEKAAKTQFGTVPTFVRLLVQVRIAVSGSLSQSRPSCLCSWFVSRRDSPSGETFPPPYPTQPHNRTEPLFCSRF